MVWLESNVQQYNYDTNECQNCLGSSDHDCLDSIFWLYLSCSDGWSLFWNRARQMRFFISNSGALLSPTPAPDSYPPTTLHVWNDYIPQARSQSECSLSNTSTCWTCYDHTNSLPFLFPFPSLSPFGSVCWSLFWTRAPEFKFSLLLSHYFLVSHFCFLCHGMITNKNTLQDGDTRVLLTMISQHSFLSSLLMISILTTFPEQGSKQLPLLFTVGFSLLSSIWDDYNQEHTIRWWHEGSSDQKTFSMEFSDLIFSSWSLTSFLR